MVCICNYHFLKIRRMVIMVSMRIPNVIETLPKSVLSSF